MNHPQLGEFEETILLVVAVLGADAYGAAVQEALEAHVMRVVTLSAVHAALHRMEKKGYLTSWVGGATSERGGRRKRFFELTQAGREALVTRRRMRTRLWNLLPDLARGLT